MAESTFAANRWIYGTAYFGLVGAIMLFQILPIGMGPVRFPGPDLVMAITFAWVLRRPQYLPTPLVALVFLVGDMLFLRPPGLMTALVVIAVEYLRNREASMREQPLTLEWATVAGTMIAMALANRLIQAVFLVEQASLLLTVLQLIATILAYPLVVLVSRFAFGVRKMAPGEIDAWGRRP